MNDPRSEIPGVVKALTMAKTPAKLRSAVYKYFDQNAGFVHPLCNVLPGPGSRESILGVYQWYRDMSPGMQAEVESLIYDENTKVAYIDVVQVFNAPSNPFKPRPARLTTRLSLKQSEVDGRYYITEQKDFYQPEDILYLTLPVLAQQLLLAQQFSAQVCCSNAAVFARVRSYVRSGMTLVGLRGQTATENDKKES
ncbi:hypothetical protein M0805_008996 [Coniferiporia weirii]|nr:hypothetical protein M0805_008996 [Coniferiporia weirii]